MIKKALIIKKSVWKRVDSIFCKDPFFPFYLFFISFALNKGFALVVFSSKYQTFEEIVYIFTYTSKSFKIVGL